MKQLNNMMTFQDMVNALIRFGSNDEDIAKAVENKIKSDSTKYQIQYYKGNKEVIKETNQTHLLRDLVYDYMNRFKASREDIEKLFDRVEWTIFSDENKTGFDIIKIGKEKYRISNQRTRNPEYLNDIANVFGEKGYEIIPL